MRYPVVTDPLDLEIEPGVPVRALISLDECTSARMRLENEMAVIRGQIARSEENPDDARPGWRTRAQGALHWKKLTVKAINAHTVTLQRAMPPVQSASAKQHMDDRHRVLIDLLRIEVGEDRFAEVVAIAKERYPALFGKLVEGGR